MKKAANLGKREISFSPGGFISDGYDGSGFWKFFNDIKFLQNRSIDEVYDSIEKDDIACVFIPTKDLQEIQKRVETYFRSEGFSQCSIKFVADQREIETGGHRSFGTGKVVGAHKETIVSDVKHLVADIKW